MNTTNRREIDSFQVSDSRGTRYTIIELVETDDKGRVHSIFETADGFPVQKLDRFNFEIQKRNPNTNEDRIEVRR